MRQVRNYLAVAVAVCVGVRLAAWFVAPFLVPLGLALLVTAAADLALRRHLS